MKIKTLNPDIAWRKLANNKGWTRKYSCSDKNQEKLKQKLLNIGGWAVCFPYSDPDIDHILNRGFRFAAKAKMMRGEPSQCHANSAALWDNNRDKAQICTGYALTKDGMWRQHSWCVIKTLRSYKVIETTLPRVSYYGYILDQDEAETFLFQNF